MSQWTAASWQAFLDRGGGSQPSWVPPSLHRKRDPWKWVRENQDFVGVGMDVAMLVALIKIKGGLIRLAGRYLWLVPAVAYGSALGTILAVEKFVGKKEARELSQWYANAVSDPLAWHVETDRVVQGAAHALIDDFTEGVVTSPAVAANLGSSAWDWAYWDHIDAWRAVGSGL